MPCRYGPFWICTTLIFVAASIGAFVTYVAHKLKKKEWNYDINLVTWSAGVFYGYVTIVPLVLYVILKYFSAPSGLVQLFCLYGYSLFVFIPALVSLWFSKLNFPITPIFHINTVVSSSVRLIPIQKSPCFDIRFTWKSSLNFIICYNDESVYFLMFYNDHLV